jgi:hypothetical protein
VVLVVVVGVVLALNCVDERTTSSFGAHTLCNEYMKKEPIISCDSKNAKIHAHDGCGLTSRP